MAHFDIKALFFDIDGTLISFNTHRVPESAAQAIKACQAKGIKAFLCTGRPLLLVPDFQRPELGRLQFDGIVAQNGGYCASRDGQPFFTSYLDPRDVQRMITYLQTHPQEVPVSMMSSQGIYINYVNDTVRQLAEQIKVPVPLVKPLDQWDGKEVVQINIYGPDSVVAPMMQHVLTHCDVSRWHPMFVDINVKGCSKASGIDRMLAHYGLPLDKTMAFGDGGNDIPMLTHVPYSVAMGNATDPAVFSAARLRTKAVEEDGVALILAQCM